MCNRPPHRLGLLAFALTLAYPAHAQLFVLSQQSRQVLAYDATDGSFQGVFADTVSEGFRNPGDIALRPSDGALYVSSISTGEIWSYVTATGEPMAPAVIGGLFAPFGLDFATLSHKFLGYVSCISAIR